jgi:sigma-B regulation protein RsbU (phosphoserine phosphatase)
VFSLKVKGLLRILLAFVSASCGAPLDAQVFDLAKQPVQLSEIHGLWRFHTGDDPGWSDPTFDDSHWELLRSDRSWNDQGYGNYSGLAWYRFKLILPIPHTEFGLYIPELSTSYQVFANGKLIGQLGGLPPHAEDLTGGHAKGRQIIPIPDNLVDQDGVVRIAIRVWHWDHGGYSPGGPVSAISIGNPPWLAQWKTLQLRDIFWSTSTQSVVVLDYILSGMAGLGLFALRRSERAYLWFAISSFFAAALWGSAIYPTYYLAQWQDYHATLTIFMLVRSICFLLFLTSLLNARKGRVFWAGVAFIASTCLVCVPGMTGWITLPRWSALDCFLVGSYMACLLILLLRAARNGNPDARLLLAPIVLWAVGITADCAATPLVTTGHLSYPIYATFRRLISWPVPVAFPVLTEFLTLLSVLAVLILRFARTHGDEQRSETKLGSARTSSVV